MLKYQIHNGTLYDYQAGIFCGVLVKENVMRKLVRLQQEHLEAVKRLLCDESDNNNVFPSSWTLHYPEGKQTSVTFINPNEDLKKRIKVATHSAQPTVRELVFIASSMDEAEKMADARFLELTGDE